MAKTEGETILRNAEGEVIVLGHKPWPGYRKAFYVAFILGWLYLFLAFAGVFSHGGH